MYKYALRRKMALVSVVTNAITCKKHFHVVAGQGGADFNYFTLYLNVEEYVIFHKLITCTM